jgi:hypothetical protein
MSPRTAMVRSGTVREGWTDEEWGITVSYAGHTHLYIGVGPYEKLAP